MGTGNIGAFHTKATRNLQFAFSQPHNNVNCFRTLVRVGDNNYAFREFVGTVLENGCDRSGIGLLTVGRQLD